MGSQPPGPLAPGARSKLSPLNPPPCTGQGPGGICTQRPPQVAAACALSHCPAPSAGSSQNTHMCTYTHTHTQRGTHVLTQGPQGTRCCLKCELLTACHSHRRALPSTIQAIPPRPGAAPRPPPAPPHTASPRSVGPLCPQSGPRSGAPARTTGPATLLPSQLPTCHWRDRLGPAPSVPPQQSLCNHPPRATAHRPSHCSRATAHRPSYCSRGPRHTGPSHLNGGHSRPASQLHVHSAAPRGVVAPGGSPSPRHRGLRSWRHVQPVPPGVCWMEPL